MQNSSSFSLWKRILLAAIGIQFLAFAFPQKDDLVELSGGIYGRSDAKFRSIDKNHTFVLKPGTRGIISEVKKFPATKNYGVCLEILNATDVPATQKCTWVYFDMNNPNMNLYSVAQDTKSQQEILTKWAQEKEKNLNQVTLLRGAAPAAGMAARTNRSVTGIVENKVVLGVTAPVVVGGIPAVRSAGPVGVTTPALVEQAVVDADAALKTALANVGQYNNGAQKAMTATSTPAPTFCPECAAKIESYALCTDKNNYMEDEISRLINGSELSPALAGEQREIIRKACIQRSLDTYPNLRNAYRDCQPQDQAPRGFVNKACVSKNYVDMTTNSFNAVAECLGDYVSGNPETKKEAALAVFSLTSWESGLHVNAASPTGAGGIGQLTQPAIADVNSRLKLVRDHLAKSDNALCNRVLLNVLNQPMADGRSKSCERTALSKNNPLKNMIYTFAYQGSQRKYLEKTALSSGIFAGVLSKDLPASERERLASSVTIWSHNTGPAGMKVPLTYLMAKYLRDRKSVKTAADVDQFLRDLQLALVQSPHQDNQKKARLLETSTFFGKIQNRVSQIAKEPRQCLAD